MHQYRVGLWWDNQGQIPDFYMEIQTNASLSVGDALTLAMIAAKRHFVVSAMFEDCTSVEHVVPQTVSRVTLYGRSDLYITGH